MIEDRFLWEKFKNGDKDALIFIYDHHVDFLFCYGKKFVTDRELIKDTIQDLFFNLMETRSNLSDTDNIKFYLLKSFRCLLLRNLKKSERIRNELSAYNFYFDAPQSIEEHLISKEETKEYGLLLRKGLKKLSSNQREILYYKFTFGLSYDEICDIMLLKYDSARKLVFRALKLLKEELSINPHRRIPAKKSTRQMHKL